MIKKFVVSVKNDDTSIRGVMKHLKTSVFNTNLNL